MDNPETMATLGKQDTEKDKQRKKRNKEKWKDGQQGQNQRVAADHGAREG
jgi:hypothetical protein